ncbi:hypothetical protein ACFV6F_22085 [Kitasatospora phosalacinea]|uniref:hypothetical protein n=1 Tax=Kitasatospora phosalacinea TaxID=2065 RepID=UPI00365142AC
MEFGRLRKQGATTATPLGELVLHRTPAKPDAFEKVRGLQSWRLELDGRPLGELPRFGGPGYHAVKLARHGLEGGFDGAGLRVTARGRHLLRSGRYVQFETGGRTLRFVRRGVVRTELLEDGRTVARSSRGRWQLAEPDPLRVCALAVYSWGGFDYANDNPVLSNLVGALVLGFVS